MELPRVVLDTNIIIAAFRSRRGWSYRLLEVLDAGKFEICLSVPVMLEYEEVSKRLADRNALPADHIDNVLNRLSEIAHRTKVHFRWSTHLPDPDDDMILEAAVAGGCQYIVTFNVRHFRAASEFGLRVRTPRQFLLETGIES